MNKWTIALLLLAACGTPGGSHSPNPDAPSQSGPDGHSGGSADAPVSTAGDPANDGPSTVTETTVAIPGTGSKPVDSTIYTPGGVSSPALVVISCGFQQKRTQYASYAHHLATWGFVVILTDYADQGFLADHQAMANDVIAVINYALAPAFTPAIDATKIATAGHSLGGDISVLAASGDPRIKAVVGWDPVDGSSPSVVPEKMTNFTAALAVIGETTNGGSGLFACSPDANNFQQFYASAPSPALAMTIDGADHMDWVDDGSCSTCSACTPAGTAPPERAHTATRRLTVAWLRSRLFADATMDTWLMSPPEVAGGIATVVHK
jgi:pimeloyl-ACP methyl ester carboxylesterase